MSFSWEAQKTHSSKESNVGDKDSRSGGKYSGNHTTLIPAAATVCDIASKCPFVTRISPGFIKAGLDSVNGKKRVKFEDVSGGIKLSVRDNVTHQEVTVYATDIQSARTLIARGARNEGLRISFAKQGER